MLRRAQSQAMVGITRLSNSPEPSIDGPAFCAGDDFEFDRRKPIDNEVVVQMHHEEDASLEFGFGRLPSGFHVFDTRGHAAA